MTTATALGLEATLLFHLNLNHSALEVSARARVVTEEYGALLALLESRPWLRVALAASGHTLERIARLEPEWLVRLTALRAGGRVEFLGTGDSELVGPLVPAAVNRWNQELGRESYVRLLGHAPRMARPGELAWSQGLVDPYLDAGYEAVLLAGDALEPGASGARSGWVSSPTERRIRVCLADAPLAQALRRTLLGELDAERWVASLCARDAARARHVLLPGPVLEAEGAGVAWERLAPLCDALAARGVVFTTGAELLADARPAPLLSLTSAAEPVRLAPGTRQALARWSLGGWDGLGVNSRCFARARELERVGGTSEDWRHLCRAWGSDLRGELTEKRWRRFERSLPPPHSLPEQAPRSHAETSFVEAPLRSRLLERAGTRLAVGSDNVRAVLDLRRGLALASLELRQASPRPLLGAPMLGPLDAELGGEPRSGQLELERPGERRATDLQPVEVAVEELAHCQVVRARVTTTFGTYTKEVRAYSQRLELRYGLAELWPRPRGELIAGVLTVLDDAFGAELWVSCSNGGVRERHTLGLARGRGHGSMRSAALFGATDGWISLDDGTLGFEASWSPGEAAVLPRLTVLRGGGRRRVRLDFLLSTSEESAHPAAPLRDFRLSIRPYRKRR